MDHFTSRRAGERVEVSPDWLSSWVAKVTDQFVTNTAARLAIEFMALGNVGNQR
jgi:hypothetical protein